MATSRRQCAPGGAAGLDQKGPGPGQGVRAGERDLGARAGERDLGARAGGQQARGEGSGGQVTSTESGTRRATDPQTVLQCRDG